MSAPLMRLVTSFDTPAARFQRDIETHYHVETIAANTRELAEYQRTSLMVQAQQAQVTVRGLGEVAQRQGEANSMLSGMAEDVGAMIRGLDDLSDGVARTSEAVYDLTGLLQEGLDRICEQMMVQQRTLNQIAQTLLRPYETQAQELRKEADKWLQSGMRNTGRDRDEDLKDATRLLGEVVENPIGRQDYVAWFNTGWLLWKHESKPPEAEEAFYRASRLSAPSRDLYHVWGLRHLAHMQYLQSKFGDAYETIQKALDVSRDHDTSFDGARHAAKTGRKQEAVSLLEACIRERPSTIVTMFAEEDFRPMQPDLSSLATRLTEEVRGETRQAIAGWRDALARVDAAGQQADYTIALPGELLAEVDSATAKADSAGYLALLRIRERVLSATEQVPAYARAALEDEARRRDSTVREMESDAQSRRRDVERMEEDSCRRLDAASAEAKVVREKQLENLGPWVIFVVALPALVLGSILQTGAQAEELGHIVLVGIALWVPCLTIFCVVSALRWSRQARFLERDAALGCAADLARIEQREKELAALDQSLARAREMAARARQGLDSLPG